jgi:hypothetical protein
MQKVMQKDGKEDIVMEMAKKMKAEKKKEAKGKEK